MRRRVLAAAAVAVALPVPSAQADDDCATSRCVERVARKACSKARPVPCIRRAALHWDVPTGLQLAIARCESRLRWWAWNPSGAAGLMQLMSAEDFRLRVEGKITAEEYVRRLDAHIAERRRRPCRPPHYHRSMTNLKPVPKIAASGVSGALTAVLVIVANAVGLDLPPEAASAIVLLGTLAGGYFKRDKGGAA